MEAKGDLEGVGPSHTSRRQPSPMVRAASAAACAQFRSGEAVGRRWSAWQNWMDRCVASQRRRYATKTMEVLAKMLFLTEGKPHSSFNVTTGIHRSSLRMALIIPLKTTLRD